VRGPGANLAGASLEGVILIGATISSTNFEGTSLVGALLDEVDPAHPRIRNSTGLRNFRDLGVGLAHVLSDHAAWTQSGGQSGQRADLTGVDLSGLDLRGVDLGAAVLRGAVLRRTNLAGALLAMADLSLVDAKEANFTNADLRGAKLERVTLSNAVLMEACGKPLLVAGQHRCPTDCTSARFDHACLLRADFSMAILVGMDLTNADLRRTNMRGASLYGASLSGVDLRVAVLDGADLTGATGIEAALVALKEHSGLRIGGSPFGNPPEPAAADRDAG